MPRIQTYAARVLRAFKGGWQLPWSAQAIANATGIDLDQVRGAIKRLLDAESIVLKGGDRASGFLYQYAAGAKIPADMAGKHGKHPTGAAWAAVRKRRANLVKARARLAAKRIQSAGSIASLLGSGKR